MALRKTVFAGYLSLYPSVRRMDMRLVQDALQVLVGAFLSSGLISWLISGDEVMSVLVVGLCGSFAAVVYTAANRPRYPKREADE